MDSSSAPSHSGSPSPATSFSLALSTPRSTAIRPDLLAALRRGDLESPEYLIRLGRPPAPSSATPHAPAAAPGTTPPPQPAPAAARYAKMRALLRPPLRWLLLLAARMYDAAAPLPLAPRGWLVDASPHVRFEEAEEAGAADPMSSALELERFWNALR